MSTNDTKLPEWPATVRTRAELDTALAEGMKSGTSDRKIEEIMESAITRTEDG